MGPYTIPTNRAIIFVGDIHGDVNAVQRALARDELPVFFGDFLDSFHFSPQKQVASMRLVLDAIEAGKALSLMGNHELSYLDPQHHQAGGWNRKTSALMMDQALRMRRLLRPFLTIPEANLLATHGGITEPVWLTLHGTTLEEKLDHLEWCANRYESPYYMVGRSRGGSHPYGGPLWCDWNDEFKPVRGITQIIGHSAYSARRKPRYFHETQSQYIRFSPQGDACVDCLQESLTVLRYDPATRHMEPVSLFPT